MARKTKAQLFDQADALGIGDEYDERTSNADLEAAIAAEVERRTAAGEALPEGFDSGEDDVEPERKCPHCGKLHASSIIPAGEIERFEGLKLSALDQSDSYRVFVCEGRFYPVVHREEVNA